jgi:hypothetical protein
MIGCKRLDPFFRVLERHKRAKLATKGHVLSLANAVVDEEQAPLKRVEIAWWAAIIANQVLIRMAWLPGGDTIN